MSRNDKIEALIQYEIQWCIDNGTDADVNHVTYYIMSLFNSFTDAGIDKLYLNKLSEE
jgi:hypothetical protein